MLINIVYNKEKQALKISLLSFIHSEGLVLADMMPSGSMRGIIGQLPARNKFTCYVTPIGKKECSTLAVMAAGGAD